MLVNFGEKWRTRTGFSFCSPVLIFVMVAISQSYSLAAQETENLFMSAPVLLSFDLEEDRDVEALKILNINVPATYFITGKFAEAHPKLVRELAQKGTIGSHSHAHPNLTEIDREAAYEDLRLSKMTLENILGVPPRWFRAPFLAMDDDIAGKAKELGFLYDSSDQERWPIYNSLASLPISNASGGILASDYEFFAVQGFTEDEALFWLKNVYMERVPIGRPFVLLMHPRLIAPHLDVLKKFIEFVKENGGLFLSADDYVAQTKGQTPTRVGFWVDLSLGAHNPDHVLEDALSMKATDVFLMAKDPNGNYYFPVDDASFDGVDDIFGEIHRRLRNAGIRVHAWVPVNKDVAVARQHPDWAMISADGATSDEWLSPSHPEWRRFFLSNLKTLIERYELDGIHLDYIRYPNLSVDFGSHALTAIRQTVENPNATISDIRSKHFTQWMDWRSGEIVSLVRSAKEAIRLHSGEDVALSAALIGDAAVSYRAAEYFGQDYSRLGEVLDAVMPMVYFNETQRPLEWISDVVLSARYKVGALPIYVGLEAYQQPGSWSLDAETFARSIAHASPGADGLIYYPYLYLFGRGEEDRNLPAAGLESAIAFADIAPPPPASKNESVLATKSLTIRLWPLSAGVVVFLVGITFAGGVLSFIFFRRRPKQINTPAILGRNSGMLPRPNALALAVLPNWQMLEAEIQIDPIPRSARAMVSGAVSRYGSRDVEKNRIAAVLDACDRTDGTIAAILSDISVTTEWINLSIHYLHECGVLGLILIANGVATLSSQGEMELNRSKDDGFDRQNWEFIERRLHESLTTICPDCGTANLAHWFWADVECRNCGSSFTILNCDYVTLSSVEKITGQVAQKNLSSFASNE